MMKNIILDMDGTIADFYGEVDNLERMYEQGFFRGLKPLPIVTAIKRLLLEEPEHVYVLSACVSQECRQEKRAWLREHLVDLDKSHIILCDVGEDKSKFFPKAELSISILVDDYGMNLTQWTQAGGIALKARNTINCKTTLIENTLNVMDSRECYDILKGLMFS